MCVKIAYGFWKTKSTGIFIDKPKGEKPKSVRTPDNIAAGAESMRKAPSTSIHRCSPQLNISKTSLGRILHKELIRTSCKVQLVQEFPLR